MHVRRHGLATDWGSWQLVEATLQAFRWARATVDPDLLVLVSGQCYPLLPLSDFEAQFLRDGGGWLGTVHPIDYQPRWGTALGQGQDDLTRYIYRWYHLPRVLPPHRRPGHVVLRVLAAIALRTEPVVAFRYVTRGRGLYLGLRRRRTPFHATRPCYIGSQWLAVDREMLSAVCDELVPGGELHDFFEDSIIADEGLLQTFLAWRRPPQRDLAVSHFQWEVAADTTTTWTLADLPVLVASSSPFARKFDPVVSSALLDELDVRNGAAPARGSHAR